MIIDDDKKKQQPLIDRLEDYSHEEVPAEKKRGALRQFNLWLGWSIWPGALLSGAAVGAGMSFGWALAAIMVGCVILVILHMLCGLIGQRTGCLTAIVATVSWGVYGRLIPCSLYAVALFGWFAVVTGAAGEMFYSAFPVGAPWMWMVVWGLVFTLSSVYGFTGMAIVSTIGSPLILLLCGWGLYYAVVTSGGWDALISNVPSKPMSFGLGVGIAIGNWLVGTACCNDMYRWCNNGKSVLAGAIGGMVIGNGGTMIIGAILGISTGQGDLVPIMNSLDLQIPAALFIIAGIWTSAQLNIYSSTLALANLINVRRFWLAWACFITGLVLAVSGIYNRYVDFLLTLNSIFPGFVGIYIADYWIVSRGNYKVKDLGRISYKVVPSAVIAWITSLAADYYLTQWGIGFPAINGVVAAIITYTTLVYVIHDFPLRRKALILN